MAQTGLAPNFNFRHTDANPVIMKRVDLDFDAVDFADELGCDRIFRRAVRQHFALEENERLVCIQECLVWLMRRLDNRQTLSAQLPHARQDTHRIAIVESGSRFVHNDGVRILRKRTRNEHKLLLASTS